MFPSKIWSMILCRSSPVPSISSWKANSSRGSISPRRAFRSHSSRRRCASTSSSIAINHVAIVWLMVLCDDSIKRSGAKIQSGQKYAKKSRQKMISADAVEWINVQICLMVACVASKSAQKLRCLIHGTTKTQKVIYGEECALYIWSHARSAVTKSRLCASRCLLFIAVKPGLVG